MYTIIDIYLFVSHSNSFEANFTNMTKYFVFLIKIMSFLLINASLAERTLSLVYQLMSFEKEEIQV